MYITQWDGGSMLLSIQLRCIRAIIELMEKIKKISVYRFFLSTDVIHHFQFADIIHQSYVREQ